MNKVRSVADGVEKQGASATSQSQKTVSPVVKKGQRTVGTTQTKAPAAALKKPSTPSTPGATKPMGSAQNTATPSATGMTPKARTPIGTKKPLPQKKMMPATPNATAGVDASADRKPVAPTVQKPVAPSSGVSPARMPVGSKKPVPTSVSSEEIAQKPAVKNPITSSSTTTTPVTKIPDSAPAVQSQEI